MSECPSCNGLNTSCPDGCGRDSLTGELNGTRYTRPAANVEAEPVAREIWRRARWAYVAEQQPLDGPVQYDLEMCDMAAGVVIASALEAARREALEQAVEKLDGIYREMCGQHGADSGEAGAAFYARKTIYELKENPNG